jgi:hypothetical protein
MEHDKLVRAIERALVHDVRDEGDTDAVVDHLLEAIRKTLERNPPFPRLCYHEFELLFADVAAEARRLLSGYVLLDWEDTAKVIADAVIEREPT